jgi:hypothetical protein
MWHMKTAKNARLETVVALAAAAIVYVAIGISLAMLDASSTIRLASIPFTAGALLPAVYAARNRVGILTAIERPALRNAVKPREESIARVEGPDIVSIAPARRTGPITFEITTLQVPSIEPAPQSRCELHKGIIHAGSVSCNRCGAVYCKACAAQLGSIGEPCWACHNSTAW